MKRELIYYSILTLVIAALLFFETDLLRLKSQHSTKVIDIESFEKLDIDLDCNIYVSLGEEQKVVFEGPAQLLQRVQTEMQNGVLTITERSPSFFAQLLGVEPSEHNDLNVYINLTSADQLISPKKGNLISNETSLYQNLDEDAVSIGKELKYLIKLLGDQLGLIRS